MKVIKSGAERETPRGVVGGAEISPLTAGAQGIYMAICRMPPGSRSRPHYHDACESAVYMTSGEILIRWGEKLEHEVTLVPGDLLYVPPRETHLLENRSETEPAEYVVARDTSHEDAVIVPWAEP